MVENISDEITWSTICGSRSAWFKGLQKVKGQGRLTAIPTLFYYYCFVWCDVA